MKKNVSDRSSSLFLMELLLSVLILSLCSAVCIRIFSASYVNKKKARDLNHIQEYTVNLTELLEGTDGTAETVQSFYPDTILVGNTLYGYFDSSWNPAASAEASYYYEAVFRQDERVRSLQLSFFSSDHVLLYETEVHFPFPAVIEIPDPAESSALAETTERNH